MDNRHRVYYLVNLNQNQNHVVGAWWVKGWDDYGFRYDSNLRKLKGLIHSLKMRQRNEAYYPGEYYQMMISCKKDEEPLLVSLMNKLRGVNYVKLEE